MHSLGAIQPNRRCVVNHDRVCWRRRCCGGDWHEPRVEAGGARHVHCDGLTGLREGGLCHGVVVGRELELYHVADIGLDIVRAVGQGAVCVADFHDMYGDLAGRHRSHGGGGCCCSWVGVSILHSTLVLLGYVGTYREQSRCSEQTGRKM